MQESDRTVTVTVAGQELKLSEEVKLMFRWAVINLLADCCSANEQSAITVTIGAREDA